MWDLTVPIIAAPMAGGPSTPALVEAVARVGGLGFLAAGYKSVGALEEEIAAVPADIPFGVNVFVPGPDLRDCPGVEAYRESLRPVAQRYRRELPAIVASDDDAYLAKIELLLRRRVRLVSFTFGLPTPDVIDALHDGGATVILTVADAADARRAVDAGADALCVQGTEAGGHRATLDLDAVPNTTSTRELVTEVVAQSPIPVIGAGGVATGQQLAELLDAGAVAVQIGTALLDADEAGTRPTYRAALHDPRFSETVVTRAFSGRPARALRNRFTDDYTATAPSEYPTVHHLTSPLRAAAAAADDADGLNLWSGSSGVAVPRGPAGEIVTRMWHEATVVGGRGERL